MRNSWTEFVVICCNQFLQSVWSPLQPFQPWICAIFLVQTHIPSTTRWLSSLSTIADFISVHLCKFFSHRFLPLLPLAGLSCFSVWLEACIDGACMCRYTWGRNNSGSSLLSHMWLKSWLSSSLACKIGASCKSGGCCERARSSRRADCRGENGRCCNTGASADCITVACNTGAPLSLSSESVSNVPCAYGSFGHCYKVQI